MGNQLLKGYAIQGEPKSGVGSQKMWKIYQGQKHSTQNQATIFAIQKRSLSRNQRDDLIAFAKKQAMGLARIRHPGVLSISQTLIEDENIIAFSTQPIFGNLTTLCRQKKLKQLISSETQLRLNIFPILDTIKFLHQNVKTAHLSINFDNLYITKEGKWKIGGLGNSQIFTSDHMELPKTYRCSEFSFVAPEIAIHNSFSPKSDIFEFGVLLLRLLDLLLTGTAPQFYKNKQQYQLSFEKDLISKLNSSTFSQLQNGGQLNTLMRGMLAWRAEDRISIDQVQTSRWLNDKMVLTVKHLQNITNLDNKQQIQFLKGLLGVLNDFQTKLLMKRIIPLLVDLLKFKQLIPSVIYISLEMLKEGKMITPDNFRQSIWPHLKKVMQGKQMTAHSIYMLVDNMKILQPVITMEGLSQTVIPLYIKCFDCPPKLKELALRQTQYIIKKMDYQFIKTKMIPKIMACIKDNNVDTHKKGLIALRKSLKILDTQTITSMVLPALQSGRKGGSDQFVNAITVSIYEILGKSLPTEVLSSKLIPTVLPYLTDPSVKAQNFYSYKNVLMVMMEKIENQRKKYWNQGDNEPAQVFTQKDFDFEEVSIENKQSTAIGKGNYNFLASYMQKKEQPKIQTQNEEPQVQNDDPFDFGGYQQPSNTQVPVYQQSSQEKHPQLQSNSPIHVNQPHNIPPQQPMKTDIQNWKNEGLKPQNKNPISPQSQNSNPKMPKLKGPGQAPKNPIKKPPTDVNDPWANISNNNVIQNQKKEEFSTDPWSGISNIKPTQPIFKQAPKQQTNIDYSLDDWDFGGSKNNNTQTISSPVYSNDIYSVPKNSTPSYSLGGISQTSQNGGGSLFGLSDDPFAELEKQKNNTPSYGGISFEMNTNYNSGGINFSMGNNNQMKPQSNSSNNDWNWNQPSEPKKPKQNSMDFDLI